jgi:hypothetical protein
LVSSTNISLTHRPPPLDRNAFQQYKLEQSRRKFHADAAADAKSALEKVESKTESAVENAADKAKANAKDAQSWIAEWRAK